MAMPAPAVLEMAFRVFYLGVPDIFRSGVPPPSSVGSSLWPAGPPACATVVGSGSGVAAGEGLFFCGGGLSPMNLHAVHAQRGPRA